MKTPGASLFINIIFWLFLSLAILPIILIVASTLFNHQIIIHDVLSMQGHKRVRNAFNLITEDLSLIPSAQWNQKLSRFAEVYQVDIVIIYEDGTLFSSMSIVPNESILKKVRYSIDQSRVLSRDRSMGKKIPLLPEANPIHPDLLMQTTDPNLFWTGVIVELAYDPEQLSTHAMISAVSDSVTGNGFLFDPVPWITIAVGVMVLAILIWVPIVRQITKPLTRMTKATELIAKGNFDVFVPEKRKDEIGRLGKAINRMSMQLEAYVKGQKRFMGDVAHELGSPMARIQFGLGALEQRIDEKNLSRLQGVMEEVNHMSDLVQELLALSRIEIDTKVVQLETVDLLPLVQTAVNREYTALTEIVINIDPQTSVTASPELLIRAISNLIRNSIKYAGEAGPITVSSYQSDNKVTIEVKDSGPGIEEKYLDQIFEPFFRTEPSRDRDTGGVGLGLAIVKTCVENCQGEVSVQNLNPVGFCVVMTLRG